MFQFNNIFKLTVAMNTYNGQMIDGKRDGRGVITFANGNSFEGDFKNDKIVGNGVFRWANGDVYTGSFKDDKRTGKEL